MPNLRKLPLEVLQHRFEFWIELAKLKDTHGLDVDLMYVQLREKNHPAVQGLSSEQFEHEINTLVWALQNQHRIHELPANSPASLYLSMVGST